MSRYTGPKNRLSRREGFDLFGKGNKLRKAAQFPGQHGPKGTHRRPTEYGIQLREKQKVRKMYGIIERQFRGYFNKARRIKGKTGETMLRFLETRLDNVVFRLGFASSRPMARQLVSHGHITLDSRRVNIPSFQVKPGNVISIDTEIALSPHFKALVENPDHHLPAWLDRQATTGKVNRLPARSDVDTPVNEQLIVEFYSR